MDAQDRLSALLPRPVRFETHSGLCPAHRAIRLDIRADDDRIERACRRWIDRLVLPGEQPCTARSSASTNAARSSTLVVRCEQAAVVPNGRQQGYRLSITPDRVEVAARTPVGCFYGLQTLERLTRHARADLPCCTIEDAPDFAGRGLLLDVTRGRVPTLEWLKGFVDRLASLKVNQLQLYIEHAFAFTFDPDICGHENGLTPDEIRSLDGYCRERFIELVPAVATLGHMGRILSLPRYRALAEIPPNTSWDAMTWPERVRGLTLDCVNPDGHRLVERIWSDVLDAFSSPSVNLCGDEPWDLGRGRNTGRWDERGRGIAYLDHIRRVHDFCTSRGRRSMFWSDVVTHYPDLFDRVPRDATVLHWGYDDQTDYAAAGRFVDAGLATYVCPGTSGWKRIINAMDLAERNIATFARIGRECGATGLLNTDWGDHGHFNMPGCSWHGIVLGASLSWRVDHPTGITFDELFVRSEWGCRDASVVRALREASSIATRCETWRMLWTPIERITGEGAIPETDTLLTMRQAAECAQRLIRSSVEQPSLGWDYLTELELACRFSALCARKLLACRGLLDGRDVSARDELVLDSWSCDLEACMADYATAWNRTAKPAGLSDIESALRAAAADVRRTFLA